MYLATTQPPRSGLKRVYAAKCKRAELWCESEYSHYGLRVVSRTYVFFVRICCAILFSFCYENVCEFYCVVLTRCCFFASSDFRFVFRRSAIVGFRLTRNNVLRALILISNRSGVHEIVWNVQFKVAALFHKLKTNFTVVNTAGENTVKHRET